MTRIEIARFGCCPEHYNPKTGSCGRCWFTYDAEAWARHIRGAALIESPEAEALPGQWLLPGVTVQERKGTVTPATGGRRREEWRGEKYCLHCGKVFSFKRQHAEFCHPTCRADYHRAERRRAKACQFCGAEGQAPYCNAHCRWQDEKQHRLMMQGGRERR